MIVKQNVLIIFDADFCIGPTGEKVHLLVASDWTVLQGHTLSQQIYSGRTASQLTIKVIISFGPMEAYLVSSEKLNAARSTLRLCVLVLFCIIRIILEINKALRAPNTL
jgi:hypothetical protein